MQSAAESPSSDDAAAVAAATDLPDDADRMAKEAFVIFCRYVHAKAPNNVRSFAQSMMFIQMVLLLR